MGSRLAALELCSLCLLSVLSCSCGAADAPPAIIAFITVSAAGSDSLSEACAPAVAEVLKDVGPTDATATGEWTSKR